MSQSRQLAAIMFTDIVGYTKLMGESEQKAFELLRKNRALQKPFIEQFNGKWLKEMGDGVLASFSAASDAVYCAKAIQKACQSEEDLSLRIGIHQGEVVFEGNDVFGDGVNIASRLEPLAPAGGILISESVQRNVLNKEDIESTFIREQPLKNVQHPIKIYQVKVSGVPLLDDDRVAFRPKLTTKRTGLIAIGVLAFLVLILFLYPKLDENQTPINQAVKATDKSIAVIPFSNISNDPEQEYFSDGMMEEILNHLVKIGELKVTSRTSSMQYKETKKSIKEIADELGVANILEGSVRKSGNKIRITVQLIDTKTDQHLWSETYDREFTDVFDIQSEVAQQVAIALNAQLKPNVLQSMEQVPTQNMEAYELYLKASNTFINLTTESETTQKELLLQAIELDSNFSTAYALLGNNIIFEAGFTGKRNSLAVAAEGKLALEKALLLNPLDAVAHAMMGAYLLWYEKDFRGAEIEQLSAQRLAPSDDRSYGFAVDLYTASARFEDAIAAANKLLEIADEPLNWARMSLARSFNGDVGAMNLAIERALEADKTNVLDYTEVARAYLIQKQYQKIPEVLDLAPDTKTIPRGMGLLAIAHDKLKQHTEAEHWFGVLKQRSQESSGGSPSFYIAMVYASRGEIEQAFQWLEKSFTDNEIELYWLKVEPEFASLHEDPRWQEMLDRVGFP